MDGSKRKLNTSLRRNLNRWILAATASFALLAGALSGWMAFDEARELQDNLLQQIATLVASRTTDLILPDHESDPEDTLVLQRLGDNSPHSLPIPSDISDGLHTVNIQGTSWRILVYTGPSMTAVPNGRFAVSQQTGVRDEVAWNSSINALLPVLILAPILMVLVSFAINRSFKPISALAKVVDKRNESTLDALPEDNVPQEITPFIISINSLFARLRAAMLQQRRFVADAAHELRTPVTALSLLAENLAKANSLEEAHSRLIPLREGLERMKTLVTQLLDLARVQGESHAKTQTVALHSIVKEVIAELYPLAEAKSIDLGMLRSQPLTVQDVSANLKILVHNALENAIRYTPAGGKVDISLFSENGKAVLQVEDTGIGIPEAELQQVSEPFYRVGSSTEPGNGLGLAISQEIAHRLGCTIILSNRPKGGLSFRLSCARIIDQV